jgi:kynurenine formamidase
MKRWSKRPEGSNWGEFGEDDELGKLSLITPEVRKAALATAQEGIVFPLSLPLDFPGGTELIPSRYPPQLRATNRANGEVSFNYPFSRVDPQCCDVVSDDVLTICLQYSTQWDSLAHWGQEFDADQDGHAEIVYYNGFRAGHDMLGSSVPDSPCSAQKLGVEKMAETCIQGRGVLVDLVTHHGHEFVRVGYDALMRALEHQGADVKTGDLLCLYTGWADLLLEMNRQPDVSRLRTACAVLDGSDGKLLQWISDSGIVAICSDNLAVESLIFGGRITGGSKQSKFPLHEHCLFKQGILLGEMWHFAPLAQWLRAHGRSHFLLTAPPLRLPGAVGSPCMPVATV